MTGRMTESDLIERLAEQGHLTWSRYMSHFLSRCPKAARHGALIVPSGYVLALRRQIETAYSTLDAIDKRLDRREAERLLPIIERYAYELYRLPLLGTEASA
jgi:hypothetical protein